MLEMYYWQISRWISTDLEPADLRLDHCHSRICETNLSERIGSWSIVIYRDRCLQIRSFVRELELYHFIANHNQLVLGEKILSKVKKNDHNTIEEGFLAYLRRSADRSENEWNG